MPLQLLPKSAAAFAPRAAPTIVLNAKVEPWLTATLKRINKIKRPLNSIPQHFRCLTETLGGEAAIWTLASLMLPKAPDADLRKDSNPLLKAISNYDMLHIEAYIVHVDMVSQHEVAFKLTTATIDTLIRYHKDIYSPDVAANSYDWPEKDTQIKQLQEDFVQVVNRFVFRTNVRALEGLEEDGAGELLDGRSQDVKSAIMNLFAPLLPPPPTIVDIVAPAPMLPNPAVMEGWWQPRALLTTHAAAMDAWRVLPSTPSPTTTSCSDPHSCYWPSMSFDPNQHRQLPSPTPSYCQPAYTTTTALYSSPLAIAPLPAFQYPSQLPHGCGSSVGMDHYDGFNMGYNTFAAPQFAATM